MMKCGSWQPIETAPKDDNPILVFNVCGSWSGGFGIVRGSDLFREYKATHWMPLPDQPEASTK